MNTLPLLLPLTSSVDAFLISIGPYPVTVGLLPVLVAAGTSPLPATLVTRIVPAGADSSPLLIDTGPPTRLRVFPGGTSSAPPFTSIFPGVAFRNPKAAGGGGAQRAAVGIGSLKPRPVHILM